MEGVTVSWFGILVATFVVFFLGALWYGPLFGKAWIAAANIPQEQAQRPGLSKLLGIGFIVELVMAYCLAMFIGNSVSPAGGAFYGFLTGFAWVSLAMVVLDLFEMRPFRYSLINAGFWTLAFTLMGLILAWFQFA